MGYYAWKEGHICEMRFWWKDEDQFYKFAYLMKAPTIVIDNNNPLVAIPSPRIAVVPMVIVDYSSITNTCADAISRFPYKLSKLYVVNILHFVEGRLLFRRGFGNVYGIQQKIVNNVISGATEHVDCNINEFPLNDFFHLLSAQPTPPVFQTCCRLYANMDSWINRMHRDFKMRSTFAEEIMIQLKAIKGAALWND